MHHLTQFCTNKRWDHSISKQNTFTDTCTTNNWYLLNFAIQEQILICSIELLKLLSVKFQK